MKRPKLSRQDIERILAERSVTDSVALVGIRGYYLDSMGKPGVNDRGIYDDAIFLITPTKLFSFQANTDPSIFRPGIATMQPGVHRYYKGRHKNRYWALRLVGETVPVTRDGQTGVKTGVALNIHKGGYKSTGSEGCQTIYPSFWDEFIELVYDAMDAAGMETIPYVLVDEVERRRDTSETKTAKIPPAADSTAIPSRVLQPAAALSGMADESPVAAADIQMQPPPSDDDVTKPEDLHVEDWKPWVFRWLRRVWGTVSGLNVAQGSTFFYAAVNDRPNWWIYAAVATGILVLLLIGGSLVSAVLLFIWHRNRAEIEGFIRMVKSAAIDPGVRNLNMIVEKK